MSPRHEGHEKREPRQRPPAPADQQLAALRQRLPPQWAAWYVPTPYEPGSGYTWCAAPAGEPATCHADIPDELIDAITEFEDNLADHIQAARQELQQAPDTPAGTRDILQRRLSALTRLHHRRHPAPAQQTPE